MKIELKIILKCVDSLKIDSHRNLGKKKKKSLMVVVSINKEMLAVGLNLLNLHIQSLFLRLLPL